MAKKTQIDPEAERWDRQYPRFPGVQVCVELLRNLNVRGSWIDIICQELTVHAGETLGQITSAFAAETDPWVRAMLISALAEAGLPEAVPFLIENLRSDDARIRTYAAIGLRHADTKDARTALWEAGIKTH